MTRGPSHADHDRHGMGIPPEAPVEVHHLLVQHGVVGDRFFELRALRSVRQFAVQEQVADLHVIAVFGQILDGVAGMAEHAGLPVDEGDVRITAPGGAVTGVIGEEPGVRIELAYVDDSRAIRALQDRHVPRPAGAVVDQGDRVVACGGFLRRCGLSHVTISRAERNAFVPRCSIKNFGPAIKPACGDPYVQITGEFFAQSSQPSLVRGRR